MEYDKNFEADASAPKKIAIIHPDLGIGGAERLIVDVALGLQELDHDITIYTSHCDKSHSFEEVSSGKLKVVVYGDFLPRQILGRFTIVCAILRQIYLVLKLLITTNSGFNFYIIDSLPSCLPIIWLYNILLKGKQDFSKVLFYCHFPDLKLAQNVKSSKLKQLYRLPFDTYEQFCYRFPHKLYVNSKFTQGVFLETFPELANSSSFQKPSVLYPCIDETVASDAESDAKVTKLFQQGRVKFLLSLNRYERKKNIELAVKSYAKYHAAHEQGAKLVISGGYDTRVTENVEYIKELEKLALKFGLKSRVFYDYNEFLSLKDSEVERIQVFFVTNVSTSVKNSLLKYTSLLLYTPSFEHFGIVPIEAMKYDNLVLAVNNGGPTETILPLDNDYTGEKDGEIQVLNESGTGYLKPNKPEIWAKVIETVVQMPESERAKLAKNGDKVIAKLFTRKVLRQEINTDLVSLSKNKVKLEFQETQRVVYFVSSVVVVAVLGVSTAICRSLYN